MSVRERHRLLRITDSMQTCPMKQDCIMFLPDRISFQYIGHCSYKPALTVQQDCWLQVLATRSMGFVLGVEHSNVVTLGKRGSLTADVMFPETQLSARDFEIVRTDRGGQATIHTPGQLVIYPILPLREMGFTVSSYVQLLLSVSIEVLAAYGIAAKCGENTGLYTENGKICFVGIRVEKGVTRHGISLNISNDLSLFQVIRPCGMSGARIDSVLKASGQNPGLSEVFELWQKIFLGRISMPSLVLSN